MPGGLTWELVGVAACSRENLSGGGLVSRNEGNEGRMSAMRGGGGVLVT